MVCVQQGVEPCVSASPSEEVKDYELGRERGTGREKVGSFVSSEVMVVTTNVTSSETWNGNQTEQQHQTVMPSLTCYWAGKVSVPFYLVHAAVV